MAVEHTLNHLPIIGYWHVQLDPHTLEDLVAPSRHHNPEHPHLIFDETSAEALIEEHFGNRELSAFRSCAVPAMQSDYFRYCAVYALGGLYSDVRFDCTAPIRTLLDDAEGQLFWLPKVAEAMNGFFAFRSVGHPFLRLAIDVATANIESRSPEIVAKITGPRVFSGLIALRQLGSIDAFLHLSRGGDGKGQPELMCEVVGSYERVVDAFMGVKINPISRLAHHIVRRKRDLPQRSHWLHYKSNIYK